MPANPTRVLNDNLTVNLLITQTVVKDTSTGKINCQTRSKIDPEWSPAKISMKKRSKSNKATEKV